jgi:hypothetical protein
MGKGFFIKEKEPKKEADHMLGFLKKKKEPGFLRPDKKKGGK